MNDTEEIERERSVRLKNTKSCVLRERESVCVCEEREILCFESVCVCVLRECVCG
jgi:hypothetical protein